MLNRAFIHDGWGGRDLLQSGDDWGGACTEELPEETGGLGAARSPEALRFVGRVRVSLLIDSLCTFPNLESPGFVLWSKVRWSCAMYVSRL